MSLQQIRTELHQLIDTTGDEAFLRALLVLAQRQQGGTSQQPLSAEETAAIRAGLHAAHHQPLKTTAEVLAKYGR